MSSLALFYPLFGLVLALAPIALGGMSDRIGRERTIRLGCAVAIGGLLLASMPVDSFSTFLVGAAVVGAASSMVTAALAAATIGQIPTVSAARWLPTRWDISWPRAWVRCSGGR
ncbi:hypothetical protein GCM10027062_31660 [Nocardioides hungaricus]